MAGAAGAGAMLLVPGVVQPGTVSGLPASPPAQTAVPESFARVDGYDRSCAPGRACVFGPPWSDDVDETFGRNGCDTRNDVLRRDLADVLVDPRTRGCVVLSGVLTDPYSGAVVAFAKGSQALEVDHVVPLSAAWDRGAWQWTPQARRAFANDPLNLAATTAQQNRSKADRMPGSWMPAVGGCRYAQVVAAVTAKWKLPLTASDMKALSNCRD